MMTEHPLQLEEEILDWYKTASGMEKIVFYRSAQRLVTLQSVDAQWSDTFPQEEGLYWFFGQDFGPKEDDTIRLQAVRVWRNMTGYSYVCGGHFIYPSEAVGVWLPMTLPEFPKR